jgi:hypothetical protein
MNVSVCEFCTLNFYLQGGYLNFGAWFMKKLLFEQKNIKILNEWHFVENKTKILQHVFQMQYFSIIIIIIQLTWNKATC